MFAADSDFEVDEEFLEAVLSCERSRNNATKKKHVEPSKMSLIQNLKENSTIQTSGSNISVKDVASVYDKDLNETNSSDSVVENDQKLGGFERGFCDISSFCGSVERKFPGPAGLLPDKGSPSLAVASCSKVTPTLSDDRSCKKEVLTYQAWQSMLESDAWKKMLADLKNVSPNVELLKSINIKCIKQRASARLLVNQKIPFLAVILQDLSSSSPDPYITLCDQTGIINGTLHRDVWKQYGEELVTGCVLLLKNIGVFSIGVKSHKNHHYLNITSNNVVSLYAPLEGRVKVINVRQYSHEEIVKSIEEWNANANLLLAPDQLSNQTPQPLFSSPLMSDKCNPNKVFSSAGSSVENSPIQRQSPKMCSTSTPLSSKNIKIKEISSNTNSPCSSRHHFPQSRVTNSSQFFTHRNAESVPNTSEIVCGKQPSLRDSSSILNLISGGDENSNCKLPLVKEVVNKQKNVLGNANISNCTNEKRGIYFPSNFSEKNCFNDYSKKRNNDKNKSNSKLSKFIFKSQNSENVENSDQDVILLRTENNSAMKLHLNKDSDNISDRESQNSVKSYSFEPKKPRTESQEFLNIMEEEYLAPNENVNKCVDFSVSSELQSVYRHVNLGINGIKSEKSTEEKNLEQVQVESVLEGLDVSIFIDDDF